MISSFKHFIKINILILTISVISCSNRVEIVEESYENGNPKIVSTYELSQNKKNKVEEATYYPSGEKKISGTFKNNKREGIWTAWHKNGTVWSLGNFEKGLREGDAKVYYESGKLHFEGQYKEDEASGTWKWYDESGKLVNEVKK